MSDIWSEALQGLQPRLGAQTYDLWLRPIALCRMDVGATIEQELGAVFITRRSDNVAVDLLGLSPKERARLRDGAEIQIGQLYTLTVTSAARAGG